MKAVVVTIIAAVLILVILSVGYIGVKTIGYMKNQNMAFDMASDWACQDFKDLLRKNEDEETTNAEYWEYEYHVNENIAVVACTALK